MSGDCDKGPAIEALRLAQQSLGFEQSAQGGKIDNILSHQVQLGADLKQALHDLTKMLMTDIETRKDVEQLKKDREILYEFHRVNALAIGKINERNARCDGAGIFENFPQLWDWYQQHCAAEAVEDKVTKANQGKIDKLYDWYTAELGWRRFIPATLTVISSLLAIYVAIGGIPATPPPSDTSSRSTVTSTTKPTQ